jgi:hypothetical protein
VRALKDNGPAATVKLPICEGILADLRVRSWPGGWSDEAKKVKAVYVGTMYGFETAGRIGEFTHCEPGSQDHCARVDDFTFVIENSGATRNLLGSGLAALRLVDLAEGRQSIVVRTVSSKGKVVVKPKLIARRSPGVAKFLDDLAAWIIHSGASALDEVFSFRKRDGTLVRYGAISAGRDQEDMRQQRTLTGLLQRTFSEEGCDHSYASSGSIGGRSQRSRQLRCGVHGHEQRVRLRDWTRAVGVQQPGGRTSS